MDEWLLRRDGWLAVVGAAGKFDGLTFGLLSGWLVDWIRCDCGRFIDRWLFVGWLPSWVGRLVGLGLLVDV